MADKIMSIKQMGETSFGNEIPIGVLAENVDVSVTSGGAATTASLSSVLGTPEIGGGGIDSRLKSAESSLTTLKTQVDKIPVITVDSSLSSSSTNPVQNKIIQSQLSSKANTSALVNYVPISGGTMSGSLTFKKASNSSTTDNNPSIYSVYDNDGFYLANKDSNNKGFLITENALDSNNRQYLKIQYNSQVNPGGFYLKAEDSDGNISNILHYDTSSNTPFIFDRGTRFNGNVYMGVTLKTFTCLGGTGLLYRVGNVVHCQNILQIVSLGQSQSITTIPEGFRPLQEVRGLFPLISGNNWTNWVYVYARPDGTLNCRCDTSSSIGNREFGFNLTWITDNVWPTT